MQKHKAFGELYQTHLSAIAKYAGRRASSADAVDVAAETFTVAWRRFDEIPKGASTRPWLYGVARRLLANQRRGNLRRSHLHERLHSEWTTDVQRPEDPPDLTPLRRAIESLSEPDREILLLAGVEELKPAEISVVLEIAPDVARNRLSRARSRLRNALADDQIRTQPTGHLTGQTDEGGQP